MDPVYVSDQSMQQTDKDALFVCPYDPVHRVAAKRYVRHVLKCRKNHPFADKANCPFNARHIVPNPELQMHISTCPDKRMIENEINRERLLADGEEVRGDTSVPSYNSYVPIDFGNDEDWDAEIDSECSGRPSYRLDPTYTKWPSEANSWKDTSGESWPDQASPPSSNERRPVFNPRAKPSFVGLGRGRILTSPEEVEIESKAESVSRPPISGPILAANFSMKPSEQAFKKGPSVGWGLSAEVTRRPTKTPVCCDWLQTSETDKGMPEMPQSLNTLMQNCDMEAFDSSEEEELLTKETMMKEKRKLEKLMRQVNKLKQKQEEGNALDEDELVKWGKKAYAEERLLEIEKFLKEE